MGTNYYLYPVDMRASVRTFPPDEDGRQRLHICKSFSNMQGYTQSPFGPIRSWQNWWSVLTDVVGIRVEDEYRTPYEIGDFITTVEATEQVARQRQFRWMQDNMPSDLDNYWLDADGFSFTSRMFF